MQGASVCAKPVDSSPSLHDDVTTDCRNILGLLIFFLICKTNAGTVGEIIKCPRHGSVDLQHTPYMYTCFLPYGCTVILGLGGQPAESFNVALGT
jgi:hypothetical protein